MMGRTLAHLRVVLGVTPSQMAARLGVAKSTYDAYERAGREPADEVLARLLEVATTAGHLELVAGKVEEIRARRRKSAPYAGASAGAQTTHAALRSRQRGQAAATERAQLLNSNQKRGQP
jgi:transcriptional regulator with XRE-family HTH domain